MRFIENYPDRIITMFKSSIVYVLIFAIFLENTLAITDEEKFLLKTNFLANGAVCNLQHPLKFEDFTSFKSGVFPEGENAGCFTACIFKTFDLIDDKGTWSYDKGFKKAKTIFKDEKDLQNVEEFLKLCGKVNEEAVTDGDKGCDRAKLAFHCFAENFEKLEFNF